MSYLSEIYPLVYVPEAPKTIGDKTWGEIMLEGIVKSPEWQQVIAEAQARFYVP